MVSVTSARPSGGPPAVPAKTTSSILPPRSGLTPCSPITQENASTTLDLPDPLGPTTQVMPGSKRRDVADANDLNPRRVSVLRYTRRFPSSATALVALSVQHSCPGPDAPATLPRAAGLRAPVSGPRSQGPGLRAPVSAALPAAPPCRRIGGLMTLADRPFGTLPRASVSPCGSARTGGSPVSICPAPYRCVAFRVRNVSRRHVLAAALGIPACGASAASAWCRRADGHAAQTASARSSPRDRDDFSVIVAEKSSRSASPAAAAVATASAACPWPSIFLSYPDRRTGRGSGRLRPATQLLRTCLGQLAGHAPAGDIEAGCHDGMPVPRACLALYGANEHARATSWLCYRAHGCR